jgi:Acyl-protein synthetase, LuxE
VTVSDEAERIQLHRRARAFIEQASRGETTHEAFDDLGMALARYQARRIPAYERLLARRGTDPRSARSLSELPAVPTDAFRLARIAAHAPRLDRAVFRTSGTQGPARGEHVLSTTATYEVAALAWGSWALFPDAPLPMTAIVLAPGGTSDSSLGFMLELFVQTFAADAHFVVETGADGKQRVSTERIARVCDESAGQGSAVLLLGTSFAFVHSLDGLAGRSFALPRGSRAMHTGGTKGRSREVAPAELRADIASTFGLPENAVVGEYGMTELSSQLYEGTLRAMLGLPTPADRPGVFVPPPWMRVSAADPETLAPLPAGETGILRIEDLANVDAAVAIQTADRGRLVPGGVELLGRAAGAPPRGCSLAIDELLSGSDP